SMPYRRFVGANLAGALCWGAGLLLTGYLAATVPGVRSVALAVAAGAVGLSVIGGVIAYGMARRGR
ncbi:MAG: hypothetical protein ACYDAQ_13090, partial [Mycobacteriales bacterium]